MEQSRTIGAVLIVVSGLQMLLFSIGIMRRSYAAIALPVMAAMAAISGLLFWVGYTMVNMQPDLTELDLEDDALEASA
jgi:hypothetical protein